MHNVPLILAQGRTLQPSLRTTSLDGQRVMKEAFAEIDLGAEGGVGRSGTIGLQSRNLSKNEEVVHERSDDMAAS